MVVPSRLVAGRGAGETTHRSRLRTEKGRGAFWEDETRSLAGDDSHQGLASTSAPWIELIAESHIAVADAEDDIEHLTTVLFELAHGLGGLVSHLTLLDSLQTVGIADTAHLTILHG